MRAFLLLGLLLILPGCGGSGTPAPLAASCSTRLLNSRLMQAKVTVTNTTNVPHRAVVYGPALRRVRYVHPVLKTVEVVVHVGKSAQSYPGWIIPRVSPNGPRHILFNLGKPTRASSILAAESSSVRLNDWNALNNPDCTIG